MLSICISLSYTQFLVEMLPKFPLTSLKLIFNVYLILFPLSFYVTPKFPPVLHDFGFIKGLEIQGCYRWLPEPVVPTLTLVF